MMEPSSVVRLRPSPAVLPAELGTGFAAYGHYSRFCAGSVIANSNDGDPPYGIVLSGVVRSCLVTRSNREYITGLYFEGQLVQPPVPSDQLCFLDAATDTSLYCFSQETLARMLAEQDWARRALPKMMASDVDCGRHWISLLGKRSVEEKLAGFFKLVAEYAPSHMDSTGNNIFEIPLRRGQMAEFLGVTSESVSRGLTALRRAGVIRLHDMRHFEVLQPAQLSELAGE
jgi:CRP/FNR family transcriptional regulator